MGADGQVHGFNPDEGITSAKPVEAADFQKFWEPRFGQYHGGYHPLHYHPYYHGYYGYQNWAHLNPELLNNQSKLLDASVVDYTMNQSLTNVSLTKANVS
jgi:hypothetical protein